MNEIDYERRKAVYAEAVERYGVEAQCLMVVEEMSELTKEICKISRGKIDLEGLADEIADVTIMLEQLRIMYDLNDAVCEHMDMKVRRLCKRLHGEDAVC